MTNGTCRSSSRRSEIRLVAVPPLRLRLHVRILIFPVASTPRTRLCTASKWQARSPNSRTRRSMAPSATSTAAASKLSSSALPPFADSLG
jgi:hypothetical protein